MRTTVRLDDGLFGQVKREANRRRATVTSLIEEGLRLVLARSKPSRRRGRVEIPISSVRGRVAPGVDLDNTAELYDIMDGLIDSPRR